MSQYRCAACGSPNVVTDTQTGGVTYNYKKGIVGTVVLGTGGAVAGIESKTQQVYKCPDCGITMTYPMDEAIKTAIDAGVQSATARERLTLYGTSVPWWYFTKKYCNIESGLADEELKLQEERQVQKKELRSQELRNIAKDIINDIKVLQAETALMDTQADDWQTRQLIWEETSKGKLAERQKEYDQAEQKVLSHFREEIEKLKKDLQNTIEQAENTHKALWNEKSVLIAEQYELGLFKGKRKKEIAKRLQELEAELLANALAKTNAEKSLTNVEKDLTEKARSSFDAAKAEINEKYSLEESPATQREKQEKARDFFSGLKELGYVQKSQMARNLVVYKFIEHEMYSPVTRLVISPLFDEYAVDGDLIKVPSRNVVEVYNAMLPELMAMFDADETCLGNFPEQGVTAHLRKLVDAGAVAMDENKRQKCYYIKQ